MAKINYGPPISAVNQRQVIAIRDCFGPGSMIGMTQRSAEMATSGLKAYPGRR